MTAIFFAYWWLLFPLAWFVSAAWQSWLSYQRRKQELDLLKSYVAQGKDPPPELTKAVSGEHTADPAANGPYGGYGPYGWRARRWGWGWSPYWGWQRAIVTGCIAGGLFYWANYGDAPSGAYHGLMIAAVVLGIISVSSAFMALMMSLNPPK
jgi:hypothetical protein